MDVVKEAVKGAAGPREGVSETDLKDFEKSVELSQNASCVQHLDELMFCLSPANQVTEFYYTGQVDSCESLKSNFYGCLRLKAGTRKTLGEKEELLSTISARYERSPSEAVWDLKVDPSKSWRSATD